MQKNFLPFLLILSLIACCIEVDISVPSFPAMARALHTSEGYIQFTIASNFLGFFIASLWYGPSSDAYGRRKIMLLGNALLLIGATGCVFAPTIGLLWGSRFIQGLGASASAVVAFAMIADVYQEEKAIKWIGVMNCVLTMLIALSPLLGGWIQQEIGWRGNYGFVALISLVSWLCLWLFLPETKEVLQPFSLTELSTPCKKMLQCGKFMRACLAPSLLYCAYLSFVTSSAFLYTETFKMSLLLYLGHQVAIVGTFSLTSMLAEAIIKKYGKAKCSRLSIRLCLIGAVCLLLAGQLHPSRPILLTGAMMLFCMGFAIFYPITFATSLEIYPQHKGLAASLIMSLRALLCAVFVGLSSTFYQGTPTIGGVLVLSATTLAFICSSFAVAQPDK